MSGKVINLRQKRKQVLRDAKQKSADENAISFGTPKAVRKLDEAQKTLAARKLDGAKRDD